MTTLAQSQELEQKFFETVVSGDDYSFQKMSSDSTDYLRIYAREEGIARSLMTPKQTSWSELDHAVDTELPFKVEYKEPFNPPAITAGFGTVPPETSLWHARYPIYFHRLLSPRIKKDIGLLMNTPHDVRQITTENLAKDMMAEEDNKLFAMIATILGTIDVASVFVPGSTMYRSIPGFTRVNLVAGKQILQQTPYHVPPTRAVCNNVTWTAMEAFTRDEVGGNKSEDLFLEGNTSGRWLGLDWKVTIKRHLVNDYFVYYFGPENMLGKFRYLEDITLWAKKEAFMLDFFLHGMYGMAIGHAGAVGCAKLTA